MNVKNGFKDYLAAQILNKKLSDIKTYIISDLGFWTGMHIYKRVSLTNIMIHGTSTIIFFISKYPKISLPL
jgi:hypothetical protein